MLPSDALAAVAPVVAELERSEWRTTWAVRSSVRRMVFRDRRWM